MAKDLFRKVALDRMSSPEQLDQTIKVIKPGSWLALLGIALFLAAVVVWGIVGTIPQKVMGRGVLLRSGQIYTINAPTTGQIKDVFVESGDTISNGQIIARLERSDLLDEIQVAERQLDDLFESYNTIVEYNKGNQALTDESIQLSQANLREQIAAMNRQKTKLQESVENMQGLYADGLVTRGQLMANESELAALEVRIRDAALNLTNLDVNRFQSSGETARQILALEQRIDEYEKQVEILRINYRERTKVMAKREGLVVEISSSKGDYVSLGTPIVMLEPIGTGVKNIQAVLYFNASDGKKIQRGMNIGISPSTVRQEEYGYIQGIVTEVSAFPVSNSYLMRNLRYENLVSMFSRNGAPIEVKADLIPNPATSTGFKWSSSEGPDIDIESGLLAVGSVTVSTQSPLSLVVPILKRKVFGVGDDTERILGSR